MNKPGYVNVDQLQAETSLAEAAAKCRTSFETSGAGKEARLDCLFGCPGDHAGRREIAVNTENPQKVFLCHAYQCGFRGNLLTLMHGWLSGTRPAGDKLKGDEFHRVKNVLAGGEAVSVPVEHRIAPAPSSPALPLRNLPLAQSSDEKVRELATINEKFIVEVAHMPPAAASYVRRHGCLSPESMRKWRVGVLPQDGGGDKRGFSLRGQIIYPLLSEEGHVLAWIGRDPNYEQKEKEFARMSLAERKETNPPMKHRFPKGCQRGLELFGQQASRLQEPGYREAIARCGIILVEGFNDVIGLDNLGVPAVGILSKRITEAQVEKVARWTRQLSGGKVSVLFDCEETGDEGAKVAVWQLLERGFNVRLGWTQSMHGGAFAGRQPESLTQVEWEEVIGPAVER